MTTYSNRYSPEHLVPVPRADARQAFQNDALDSMLGDDHWNCYELSWLQDSGVPAIGILSFSYPACSSHLIESKSLKLYLMSFNQSTFSDEQTVLETIQNDLSEVLGTEELSLVIEHPDASQNKTLSVPEGICIDSQLPSTISYTQHHNLLGSGTELVKEQLYSHVLRSVCPITGQPDYGSVQLCYYGPQLDRASLLAYLVGFRNHGDYHEHCAERIFVELMTYGGCHELSVRCSYTRRGGIDISPCRYTKNYSTATPYRRFVRH